MLDAEQQRVRLHITPLTTDLCSSLFPATLLNKISNVSLHAIQTFPEREFGFVNMPRTDADILKKKLNGMTLKGTKLRIEEARPRSKRKSDGDGETEPYSGKEKAIKRVKIDKTSGSTSGDLQGVLEGHRLEDGRHVKRAWKDDTGLKSRDTRSSRGTKDITATGFDKSLLFRTKVPPNIAPVDSKLVKKDKKSKDKTGSRDNGMVVVEEFKHHKKSFAIGTDVATSTKSAVEYVDGEGWVDEDGMLVEAIPKSMRARPVQPPQSTPAPIVSPQRHRQQHADLAPQEQSSNDTSSDDAESQSVSDTSNAHSKRDSATPQQVHPLEALYKKPPQAEEHDGKLRLAPIDTTFSFFGTSADEPETVSAEGVRETYPQTPHTKQDFEWRAQRSAAPTPDTAAIDGRFGFPFGPDDEDEDDEETGEEDDESPVPSIHADPAERAATPAKEESAFRKYFYEHRGENNREWKRKRREARKQQRQRENRRLSRRVV